MTSTTYVSCDHFAVQTSSAVLFSVFTASSRLWRCLQETDEDLDTRAAFQLLRDQYSNTAEFVSELFKEPGLQIKCRIIVEAAKALHAQYVKDCKIQADGQLPQLHWWAERSNGHWFKTVATILDVDMQRSSLIERFGLRPRPSLFSSMKRPWQS